LVSHVLVEIVGILLLERLVVCLTTIVAGADDAL
jgi:hypothetical protein